MVNYFVNCPQCGKINIKSDFNRGYVSCIHCSFKYEERKASVRRALLENEQGEYLKIFMINTEIPRFIYNKLPLEQRDIMDRENNQRLIDFINKLTV